MLNVTFTVHTYLWLLQQYLNIALTMHNKTRQKCVVNDFSVE